MKTILITGGAGYVGSHSALHFQSLGWRVVVADDLSTGHREFADRADRFVELDLTEPDPIRELLASERFDGVLHCAARALVGESVEFPIWYFQQNVGGMLNLLDAVRRAGGVPIVFSSTCATYGEPQRLPMDESHPQVPVNPYGESKLAAELAMFSAARAHRFPVVAVRYFNVAGADPASRLGERHDPETHLIPLVLLAGLTGGARPFSILGDDYPTRDGTCVRDYIHVMDLARGHALAFEHLWGGGESTAFNLGTGNGFTVREVFDACQSALGTPIPVSVRGRRPGDPASLVADASKAARVLGWTPARSTLDAMLADALRWHRRELGRSGDGSTGA